MTNKSAFEILSLPCSLDVSPEEIENAWRELSKTQHPDVAEKSDPESAISDINQARAVLLRPSGRLAEWLKEKEVDTASRNTAISSSLMDLFTEISRTLNSADEVIASLKKAQTALAKSLLAPKAVRTQLELQTALGQITQKAGAITATFPELEEDSDFDRAREALGELKFLEKWERECQNRLLELIGMD